LFEAQHPHILSRDNVEIKNIQMPIDNAAILFTRILLLPVGSGFQPRR
jgi:hypothetical protein